VGMLKRLRGTPIVRHDERWGMVYSPAARMRFWQTRLIDYATMQRLRRFARYWDLVANSGNFVESAPLIWSEAFPSTVSCASATGYLRPGADERHRLKRLAELLFDFLTREAGARKCGRQRPSGTTTAAAAAATGQNSCGSNLRPSSSRTQAPHRGRHHSPRQSRHAAADLASTAANSNRGLMSLLEARDFGQRGQRRTADTHGSIRKKSDKKNLTGANRGECRISVFSVISVNSSVPNSSVRRAGF